MSRNLDRATKRWVAQQFHCPESEVTARTEAGEIPYASIYEGVRGDGSPFTEYRYSKRQIVEFQLERARLKARRAEAVAS